MSCIGNEIFNISRVSLRVLEPVKVVTPFQDATMGPFVSFGLALLILEDEDGNIGESPVYSTYTNILETCLLPILLHNKTVPYHMLYQRLYWSIRNEGFRGPASALLGQIDLALHDLAARRSKLPLHKYLKASRNHVRVYGSGGGTNYTLENLEEEINGFLEAGIDCYKMKVGKDFGKKMNEDIDRVKFVRSLLGKEVRLAVDANQVWNINEALKFIDLVADQEIAWFEEPLHSAAYEQIAQLCEQSPVKISYGESERTSKMFPTLLNIGVKHLQPVPTHLGSVKEWMDVRDMANNSSLDFSSGGYTMYTASLMASAPEHFRVEYLYSIMVGLEFYFEVCPKLENGKFLLPEIDGLPIRVDWEYWFRMNKVVKSQSWQRENVKEYLPNVTM